MEPRLLLGASQLGWVTTLTHWISEHGDAQLVGQALTTDDVVEADFDLLVLDGWSSLLNRRLVDQAERDGAAVLVLVNADRPESEANRLDELGVSLSLPVTCAPEAIVARGAEVAAVRRFTASLPTKEQASAEATDAGRLVVILGEDGVTEVAVNLAAAVSRSTGSVTLVDFDTVEPAIAQRLDLPIVPNLLTAVDHVRQDKFGGDTVTRHLDRFSVIAGLANPREWDEITSVHAGEVVALLRERTSLTLAVVHPMLEDLAPLSGLEGRFDVGRRLVEMSDGVIVVGSASPVGMVRTLSTVADVRTLTPAPIHLTVNRMPADRFLRDEWSRELRRTFTPASLSFLPYDRHVLKAAWDGRIPDRGMFRKELRRLTGDLLTQEAA